MIWYDMSYMVYDMIQYMIWYDTIYDMIWYGMMWCDVTWRGVMWCDAVDIGPSSNLRKHNYINRKVWKHWIKRFMQAHDNIWNQNIRKWSYISKACCLFQMYRYQLYIFELITRKLKKYWNLHTESLRIPTYVWHNSPTVYDHWHRTENRNVPISLCTSKTFGIKVWPRRLLSDTSHSGGKIVKAMQVKQMLGFHLRWDIHQVE